MYNVQDYSVLYDNVVRPIICYKCLHDSIISLTGENWTHSTSLIPPLFIEVPVPNQEIERSCICVLVVSICLFLRFWYLILELFGQCGVLFCFFLFSILFHALNFSFWFGRYKIGSNCSPLEMTIKLVFTYI